MINHQQGPQGSADALEEVVGSITYKEGWQLWLEAEKNRPTEHLAGSVGLTLCIAAHVRDSFSDGFVQVEHWFAVPPAEYDLATWERWVLERIFEVEKHEAMEFFRVHGQPVFLPNHGPLRDPYVVERKA